MIGLIPAGPGPCPGASGMSSQLEASTSSTRSGFCSLNARYSVSTARRSARSRSARLVSDVPMFVSHECLDGDGEIVWIAVKSVQQMFYIYLYSFYGFSWH